MTSVRLRTRSTRAVALAALSVALTTVAAAPASAGPLDDLLAAIDTGSSASSGSSTPEPSAPPVEGAQSYDFTIAVGYIRYGDFVAATVTGARCVAVAGIYRGEPITTTTRIEGNSRTEWTLTREATSQCADTGGYASIDLTNKDGRSETVIAGFLGGFGRATCESSRCRVVGDNYLEIS